MKRFSLRLIPPYRADDSAGHSMQELAAFGLACACSAAATLTGLALMKAGVQETVIVLVYLIAVLLSALFGNGYAAGVIASVLATALFNYFFTKPYFTFSVDDPSYVFTFIMMLGSAFLISTLIVRIRQEEARALWQEKETKALYTLTSRLSNASDHQEILQAALQSMDAFFESRILYAQLDEHGQIQDLYSLEAQAADPRADESLAPSALLLTKRSASPQVSSTLQKRLLDVPVIGRDGVMGLLQVPDGLSASRDAWNLLHSMAESLALALDRQTQSDARIRSEELSKLQADRSSLLRSISHDLRTPLADIMGLSEIVMDPASSLDECRELGKDIHQSAASLHKQVESILHLTRLQDGGLHLQMQEESAEELIGSAISRCKPLATQARFDIRIEPADLEVKADGSLIVLVLQNLIENALHNTDGSHPIEIEAGITQTSSASASGQSHSQPQVCFLVRNFGSSIDPKDLPHLFEDFYQPKNKPAKEGFGLGLAICRAIVHAHHGSIEARSLSNPKGAEFLFTLPQASDQPIENKEPDQYASADTH